MTDTGRNDVKGRAVLRWIFAAAVVFAVFASGLFTGLFNRAGLLYLVFGSVAAAFMGFTRHEIGAAFRHAAGRGGGPEELARSAYFWQAAARNAWILGALGSAINFALVLGGESGGIADVSHRMIQSFVVTLYGLVLAVILLVPAMKIAELAERAGAPGAGPSAVTVATTAPRFLSAERVASYVSFAAVLVLTALPRIRGAAPDVPLPPAKVMLHGPAILVVLGGGIALALFMGAGTGARAWTLGFATMGLVALLTGLIQSLFGFVHTSVQEIAAAIAFIVSASAFALLGLVTVASPLEDREVTSGRRRGAGPVSRMFWVLLPLVTFIFLVLAFIMVVTPMKVKAG
jgi:hypothetical protein